MTEKIAQVKAHLSSLRTKWRSSAFEATDAHSALLRASQILGRSRMTGRSGMIVSRPNHTANSAWFTTSTRPGRYRLSSQSRVQTLLRSFASPSPRRLSWPRCLGLYPQSTAWPAIFREMLRHAQFCLGGDHPKEHLNDILSLSLLRSGLRVFPRQRTTLVDGFKSNPGSVSSPRCNSPLRLSASPFRRN